MPDGPRILADLRVGVRLTEAATGTVWEVERVRRANSYSTPWVHLVAVAPAAVAGERRVEGAGSFLDGADPPAWHSA